MSEAAPDGPGVVVVGTDAEAVADRVEALRAAGRRAAGFVGDSGAASDVEAAAEMAAELYGADATVEVL